MNAEQKKAGDAEKTKQQKEVDLRRFFRPVCVRFLMNPCKFAFICVRFLA